MKQTNIKNEIISVDVGYIMKLIDDAILNTVNFHIQSDSRTFFSSAEGLKDKRDILLALTGDLPVELLPKNICYIYENIKLSIENYSKIVKRKLKKDQKTEEYSEEDILTAVDLSFKNAFRNLLEHIEKFGKLPTDFEGKSQSFSQSFNLHSVNEETEFFTHLQIDDKFYLCRISSVEGELNLLAISELDEISILNFSQLYQMHPIEDLAPELQLQIMAYLPGSQSLTEENS